MISQFYGIHLRAISQWVPKLVFCLMSCKIMPLKLIPHLLRTSELKCHPLETNAMSVGVIILVLAMAYHWCRQYTLGRRKMAAILQTMWYDGLVEERCNSSASAMELRLSCTNPSICAKSFFMWKFFIQISMNFVPKDAMHNKPALAQIMDWCIAGDKASCESNWKMA